MKSYDIQMYVVNTARALSNGFPFKISAEYKESSSGTPYIVIETDYSACYFASTRTWNIYKQGNIFKKGITRDVLFDIFKGEQR